MGVVFFNPVKIEAEIKNPFPLVVLIERNPWLSVIGSDSPSFVLYDSGLVIFIKKVAEKYKYFSTILGQEEINKLYSPKIVQTFFNLKSNDPKDPDYFDTVSMTDQPTNTFVMWQGEKKRKIYVYGRLRDDKESRDKTPKELLALFDQLIQFDKAEAKKWSPEKIEVMAWSYDYAPEGALDWPPGLPDLNHPTTVKRENIYSIYVDQKQFEQINQLMKKKGDRQAIAINGKKMSLSFRYPLPGEEIWMK